jgi:hypothetical protein
MTKNLEARANMSENFDHRQVENAPKVCRAGENSGTWRPKFLALMMLTVRATHEMYYINPQRAAQGANDGHSM